MGAKKKKLFSHFLRKKPTKILINLNNDSKIKYASVLAKEVDCTYSHTVRILNTMEKNNLVKFDKKGRLKTISLTPTGKKIATHLSQVINLFNGMEK